MLKKRFDGYSLKYEININFLSLGSRNPSWEAGLVGTKSHLFFRKSEVERISVSLKELPKSWFRSCFSPMFISMMKVFRPMMWMFIPMLGGVDNNLKPTPLQPVNPCPPGVSTYSRRITHWRWWSIMMIGERLSVPLYPCCFLIL